MHTVELLEEAIDLAKRWGFVVREDWLGGILAGSCQFNNRSWIFLDLALSPREKLDEVVAALQKVASPPQAAISAELRRMLNLRQAA